MAKGRAPAARPDDDEEEDTTPAGTAGAGDDEDDEGVLPWDEEFRDWEQSINQEKTSTALILYRLDPEGQKPATHAWKWVDKIPSDHECGLQVGSGKFRAVLTVSKGQRQPRGIKNKVIYLDATYDEARAELKARRALEASRLAPAAAAAAPTLGDSIAQMEALVRVIQPLLALQAKAAPPSPFDALPGLQNMLGSLVKQSFSAQVEAYQRAAQLAGEGKPVVTAAEPGQITAKDLWGFALEYGPRVLEAFGLTDKVAAIFNGGTNGKPSHVGPQIPAAS